MNKSPAESQLNPETDTSSFELDTTHVDRKKQFGISAIFWTTFIIALAISHLQNLGSQNLLRGVFASVGIGIIVGLLVGFATRKIIDTLIWATLIASFGYICVASDAVFSMQFRIAWATIGAVSGAIAGSCFTKRIGVNILLSAIAALIIMGVWLLVSSKPFTSEMTVDLIAAPVVGAMVAIFIRLLTWIETSQNISRYFTATALMVMIVIGNAVAKAMAS